MTAPAPRTPGFLLLGALAVAAAVWLAPHRPLAPAPPRDGAAARGPSLVSGDLGPPDHNCRFWALVGQDHPAGLLAEHLLLPGNTTLRSLGGGNRDGWGFAAFPAGGELRALLDGPLVRRGGPPAENPPDPNFERAVAEITRIRPRALLGHVRQGSSGHWGIPNPHPFLHRGLAFAHNGTVAFDVCQELMDAELPGFRAANPPEYTRGNIDSEIYFLWLLCHAEAHPELPMTEAVREAVQIFYERVEPQRLNFVMTRGDTLWALRCSGYDTGDPVRYFPNDDPDSPFWVVASQPVGSEGSRWARIPETSLGVFVPGQPPAFYPVHAGTEPLFTIHRLRTIPGRDEDGDGFCSSFRVWCRPAVDAGSHAVRLRVLQRGEEDARLLAESATTRIAAGGLDSLVVEIAVTPADLAPALWDLDVELVETDPEPRVVASAGPGADPLWGLAGLRIEGIEEDAGSPSPPPPPPDPLPDWMGIPRPNPARGAIWIPIRDDAASEPLTLQIWDARGALVYESSNAAAPVPPPSSAGPLASVVSQIDATRAPDGARSPRAAFSPIGGYSVNGALAGEFPESAVVWDLRTTDGRRAPAGVYFARVRAGSRIAERRFVVAR